MVQHSGGTESTMRHSWETELGPWGAEGSVYSAPGKTRYCLFESGTVSPISTPTRVLVPSPLH
jgi:hypothetical protein